MTKISVARNKQKYITANGSQIPRSKAGIWWLIATTVGFGLGALALAATTNWPLWLNWAAGQSLLNGVIFGLVAGVAQWLVLQRLLPNANGWIWASVVGSVAGFTILDLHTLDALFPLYGLALGATVGIAQWLFLKQRVASASIWIAISMLSALLVSVTPVLVLSSFTWGLEIGARSLALLSLALGLSSLLVSSGIQGGALVWIIER